MKIGFIGLGAMGYPMARNLARAHEVLVWSRTAEKARRHAAEHGTTAVGRLEELADCEALVTIVPTSREVDELVDVLAPRLARGTLWIDATSGDPLVSRETACRLGGAGVDFVDAPVSGGTPGAEAGTLTMMVGGSAEQFERARALLTSMGSRIVHVGPVGSGHAIKVITNSMMAANLWVAAEAITALKKHGFDMGAAFEVINGASGRSNVTENLLPKRVIEGEWPLTFRLALLDKDVRIAASLSHAMHMSAPMLSLATQLCTAALREMGGEADYIDIVKYVGRMNQEEWE